MPRVRRRKACIINNTSTRRRLKMLRIWWDVLPQYQWIPIRCLQKTTQKDLTSSQPPSQTAQQANKSINSRQLTARLIGLRTSTQNCTNPATYNLLNKLQRSMVAHQLSKVIRIDIRLSEVRVHLKLAPFRQQTKRKTSVILARTLQVPSKLLIKVVTLWPSSAIKWLRIEYRKLQVTKVNNKVNNKVNQHLLSKIKDKNLKLKPIISSIAVTIKIANSRQGCSKVRWITRIKWLKTIVRAIHKYKAIRQCFSARSEVQPALQKLNNKLIKIDEGHLSRQQLVRTHLLLVNLPRISNINYHSKRLQIDPKVRVLARNLLGVSRI